MCHSDTSAALRDPACGGTGWLIWSQDNRCAELFYSHETFVAIDLLLTVEN